jgi:hypothetical protein
VAGGADRGFHCFVQTILCRDCKALFDTPTRVRVPVETPSPAALRRTNFMRRRKPETAPSDAVVWQNRLRFFAGKKTKWIALKPRCPNSAAHRIELWAEPGRCPRCATRLERTVTPYRIWD